MRNRRANGDDRPDCASGRVMSVEGSIVLQLDRRRAVEGEADWIDGADTEGVFRSNSCPINILPSHTAIESRSTGEKRKENREIVLPSPFSFSSLGTDAA